MTNFLNFDYFQNFAHFQNFCPFSEFLPIIRIFAHFQNVYKLWPILKILTNFQKCWPVTWIKSSNNKAPLASVANLPTRWRHLHKLKIWPSDGVTCISCNFGHQMAPLALVANLPTRWRYLHCFQSWPPDCITCIATLLYWHYQLALSWYPHQPESHQLSLQNLSYSLTKRCFWNLTDVTKADEDTNSTLTANANRAM